jgi:hypothetical protein
LQPFALQLHPVLVKAGQQLTLASRYHLDQRIYAGLDRIIG